MWAVGVGPLHLTTLNIYCCAMLLMHPLCMYHRKFQGFHVLEHSICHDIQCKHPPLRSNWQDLHNGADRRTCHTASLKAHSLVLGRLLELTQIEVRHLWLRNNCSYIGLNILWNCWINPPLFPVWFLLPLPQECMLHGVFQADAVNPAARFIFQSTHVFKMFEDHLSKYSCLNLCHLPFFLIWY